MFGKIACVTKAIKEVDDEFWIIWKKSSDSLNSKLEAALKIIRRIERAAAEKYEYAKLNAI